MASSDDSVLVGTREEEDEKIKESSVAKWLRQNRERRDYYAGIRKPSRGISFGKEVGKVIISLK